MSLRKQLNGAYEQIECIQVVGVKYCDDNTMGTKPMIDFYNNQISVDAPIINDLHDDLSIGGDPNLVGLDVNEEINNEIEVDILNLVVRS